MALWPGEDWERRGCVDNVIEQIPESEVRAEVVRLQKRMFVRSLWPRKNCDK